MVGFAVLLVVFIFVAPIVAIVWLFKLSGRVRELSEEVARLSSGAAPAAAPPPAQPAVEEISEIPEPESFPTEKTVQEEPEPTEAPTPEPEESPWEAAARVSSADETTASEPDPKPAKPAWEERLASSWMIWLGGVTVALAAVFLFRYAIEQGYLTPLARVVLGVIGGGVLLAAGEWTQRNPIPTNKAIKTDYVPPALSAAGIFAILASLFSAHALYGLIGPGTAFITMALTVYSALVLSLRQGWFVALLGIVAGYITPALITSPEPNAVGLFVYLFVLSLGGLALMVWRRWIWFSVLTIAGALTWPVLWTWGPYTLADQGVLGVYTLALAAAMAALSTRLPIVPEDTPFLRWVASVLSHSSGLGFALSGALLVYLGLVADFNPAAFWLVVAYAALSVVMGVWRPSLESLVAIAAGVTLVALLVWPQPVTISDPQRVQELGLNPVADAFGPFVMPPEFHAFSRALWAFAAIFGLGCFAALRTVRAKVAWAGLSAFMPVILFVVGYWRIGAFQVDITWSYWAVGLSVALLLATLATNKRLSPEDRDAPVGLYAAGTTAAIALIFTCLLREAWLTVALAVEIAALAWIWSRLRVAELKSIALVVLAVVVLRLIANPMVLEYQGSILGAFGWVIYGYGLPAVATFVAARIFAKDERDLTVTLCEIAAVGFAFLMVSLQLRLWSAGDLAGGRWDFLDCAMQAVWWIVAGALLTYRPFAGTRSWAEMAGLAVLGLSALLIFAGPLIIESPLFVSHTVGRWPLVNLLALAYLIPAILYLLLSISRDFLIPDQPRKLMRVGGGILIFAYITLEVRRAFQGETLLLTFGTYPQNGEIYAYSVAWIVFALVLLALGIRWVSQPLRYASLAVLLVTVAKVFLYDMSDLTGLFRVASFLGLGLTLIGIGRVYQRYVFKPEPAPETDDPN